jgi:phosphate:Na+ symporter
MFQAVAAPTGDGIDVVLLVVGVAGGLALFLFGMDRLTDALKLVAGDRMRAVLSRLTNNRFAGAATGAAVTATIQSSSATTVLVVGFVTSGLMTLEQSVGVIMGANVGTTVTAQIIAFRVTEYALALVAIGFAVTVMSDRIERQALGSVVLGLGLVFFGMSVMADALTPLQTFDPFLDAMAAFENPLLGLLAGAAFTAVIQSSSATTGIVIVMAGQGLMSLEAGIAVIVGANVGTAVTAVLAATGKSRDAQRAALVHVLFNVGGAVIWVWLVGWLADVLSAVGGSVPHQIANAHTVFNVANTLLFIGFAAPIAHISTQLLPDRPEERGALVRPKYLDRELLTTPALAIDRARLELLRLADRVGSMLDQILPAVLDGPRIRLFRITQMDDEVDALYGHIVTYLGGITTGKMTDAESDEVMGLMEAANNLESVGDIIETNLTQLGIARLDDNVHVSLKTRRMLERFHTAIRSAFEDAIIAVTELDRDAADRVGAMKKTINAMERSIEEHQAARLVVDEPRRLETYRLEMDLVSDLKRIYYLAKRTARAAMPVEERTAT